MGIILAIESSCDETAAAVLQDNIVLSNVVSSQFIHAKYGGVVPELASRAHQKNIVEVVQQSLTDAEIKPEHLDAIAFTRGPGLMGALLVGVSFAKSMAQSLGIPIIEVNHMEAHVLAHFIQMEDPPPPFPFLCLTVSGGHTQIVRVDAPLQLMEIGKTLDDAAGEAFDKSGILLGLDYPAGPQIDRLAKGGNPLAYKFPIPKINRLNYSFSGLKTAILYFLQEQIKKDPLFIESNKANLAASIQHTIIKILMIKLEKAAVEQEINHIAIAGGVSANSELRKQLKEIGSKKGWKTYIPPIGYTTDNAAMIGIAAHFKLQKKDFAPWSIQADPRLKIGS
jgi:N6-L-threonylcarbamoyladenine synthase